MDTIAREATAVRRAYADHQRTPRSP
jgi:hypothetical protein